MIRYLRRHWRSPLSVNLSLMPRGGADPWLYVGFGCGDYGDLVIWSRRVWFSVSRRRDFSKNLEGAP